MISDVRSAPPLGASDHLCVLFNLEIIGNENNNFTSEVNEAQNVVPDRHHLQYYNTNKTDWPLIIDYLNWVDWNEVFGNKNCIDYCWESFYSVIVYAISLCTPAKRKLTFRKPRTSRKRTRKLYKS